MSSRCGLVVGGCCTCGDGGLDGGGGCCAGGVGCRVHCGSRCYAHGDVTGCG